MAANNASLLPLIPRIFFLYLEPVLISYGIFMNLSQTTPLIAAHLGKLSAASPLPLPALFIPAQSAGFLLNVLLYGLIIMLATPPNRSLLKAHIWILIFADATHWAGLAATVVQADPRGRGLAALADTSSWDADTWNLATYPIYTLAIKFLTLAGAFGAIRER